MLKEAVILMVITTIVVSLVSAQDDPYHKCVDECYSTCFADIAGCYEYCKQDCKHPNFSASKFHQCSVDACLKLKGGLSFSLPLFNFMSFYLSISVSLTHSGRAWGWKGFARTPFVEKLHGVYKVKEKFT